MSGDTEMRDLHESTSADLEVGDVSQLVSDDIEMKDAHQPMNDNFEMRDVPSETISKENQFTVKPEEKDEYESTKECMEKPQSPLMKSGVDSPEESLKDPQLATVQDGDESAKERVKEPQSTALKDRDKHVERRAEEPLSTPVNGECKSTKENEEEPQSTPDKSAKESLEDPHSTPARGRDKSTKEREEEPQSSPVKESEISAEKRLEEPRSALVKGEHKATKEVEEPQSVPTKGEDKSTKESEEELQSTSSKGGNRSAVESMQKPLSPPVKGGDMSAVESIEEPLSAPVEGGDESPKENKEKPQPDAVKGVDEYPRKNVGELQTAAVKSDSESTRESLDELQLGTGEVKDESLDKSKEEQEPPAMTLEEMVEQLQGTVMHFERDIEDSFEKVLVYREKKRNLENPPVNTAKREKAVDDIKLEQHKTYFNAEGPHEQITDKREMDSRAACSCINDSCKQVVDEIRKDSYLDAPRRQWMGERYKEDYPYSYEDYPTERTLHDGEKERNSPCKNQVADRRQEITYLDGPGRQLMDKREKENYPHKDNPAEQTVHNREKERNSPCKNQGTGDHKAAGYNGNGSDYGSLRHQAFQDRGDYRAEGYSGNRGHYYSERHEGFQGRGDHRAEGHKGNRSDNDLAKHQGLQGRGDYKAEGYKGNRSDYDSGRYQGFQDRGNYEAEGYKVNRSDGNYSDDSLNRMSSDEQPWRSPRKTNNRRNYRGRGNYRKSDQHHYASYGQQSSSGKNSTYGESFDPSKLISVLSEFSDFRASLLQLMEEKNMEPSTVRDIVNAYTDIFRLVGESVEFRPKLALCNAHLGKHGCQNITSCRELHMCSVYLRSYCHTDNCALGHKLFTDHNKQIFQSFYIKDMSAQDLRKLVKLLTDAAGPSGQLEICKAYNEGKCSNYNCDDLHVCHTFVAGRSKCSRSGCRLNHDILTRECCELLKRHGFSTNEAPRDVVMALLSANPSIASKPGDQTKNNSVNNAPSDTKSSGTSNSNERSHMIRKGYTTDNNTAKQGKSSKTLWSQYLHGDSVLAEICYYSVEGTCRDENKGCPRLHSFLHFHWQASEQGTNWLNLCNHQVKALESAFCNPVQDGVMLPQIDPAKLNPTLKGLLTLLGRDTWKANFEAMLLTNSDCSKIMYLKRLCTERIPGKTLKPNTYVWYFLDKNNKWVKYGNVDTAGEKNLVSSVTSADIEKHFCKSPGVPLIFGNASFTYSLDFGQMTQKNQKTKVIRKVRRRPEPHMMPVKN